MRGWLGQQCGLSDWTWYCRVMSGHWVWLGGHDWAEKVFSVKNTGLGLIRPEFNFMDKHLVAGKRNLRTELQFLHQ